MNRLVTLTITLMIIGAVTSLAWAGGFQNKANQYDSYHGLSPAVFFGYTDINMETVRQEMSRNEAAHVNKNKMFTCEIVNYDELLPAVFFGYTIPNMIPAKTISANSECIERADCCKLKSKGKALPACCRVR